MRTSKLKHLEILDSRNAAAAEPVAETGDKYQVLFDQASDAILTVTSDGRIDAANQAIEELTGYLKTELIGSGISTLVPDSSKQQVPHRSRVLNVDFFKSPGTYEDVAILRKDGYTRFVDLSVRIVSQGNESTLTLALFRDITEKKQMERELITKHSELRNTYFQLEKKTTELQTMQDNLVQAGKMAALGELTAGIAHELNQPLQAIRGYAQELRDVAAPMLAETNARAPAETCMAEIISNVDKMAGIIDYLRTFTRKSIEKHEFTDLHNAVNEALKMLARQFQVRGILVHRVFGSDVPKVYANPLQLEQIFINLATNARDAIEATGRGKGTVWIRTRKAGNFVEVLFKDDGSGMSERTKSKAFNPFFTTKEVGRGMGMGLSLSYGILSKLNGTIVVESEFGKGAAFLIRIPVDYRELG